MLKKGSKEKRLEQYWKKEIQSEIYKKKKRQKMQDITGIQFITKKNIRHYVSVRTNGWNQSLEGSQSTYWK